MDLDILPDQFSAFASPLMLTFTLALRKRYIFICVPVYMCTCSFCISLLMKTQDVQGAQTDAVYVVFCRNTGEQSPLAAKSLGGLRKDDGGKETVSCAVEPTK